MLRSMLGSECQDVGFLYLYQYLDYTIPLNKYSNNAARVTHLAQHLN